MEEGGKKVTGREMQSFFFENVIIIEFASYQRIIQKSRKGGKRTGRTIAFFFSFPPVLQVVTFTPTSKRAPP